MSDLLYDKPQLPMDDERYRIVGNAFSLTAWSRDNEPKESPRFRVGDTVLSIQICEVTKLHNDCDGTPLYALDHETGYADEGLIPFVGFWQGGHELFQELVPEIERLVCEKLAARKS